MGNRKRFFAEHARSSAAFISLAMHGILIIAAFYFVAVKVMLKEDQVFETRPVSRPKMQLKKLQVPVDVKKRAQKPRLRKRIVVEPRLNQAPEIRLPEISGVKGGIGSAGDGMGTGSGLGFSIPEIKMFGIKAKGEKVFIILDASPHMMVDGIGGIPAYTIIKSELVRILNELNPSVLFNIVVYGGGDHMLFPGLVPATEANVGKVEAWLEPLNAVSRNMGDRDYGPRTLGPGGRTLGLKTQIAPLKSNVGDWARPTMASMQQQADIIFILSCRWGHLAYRTGEAPDWSESQWSTWKKNVARAQQMHREENAQRRANGRPPRVIPNGSRGVVKAYLPHVPRPPGAENRHYTPKELVEAFGNMRQKHEKVSSSGRSGISGKEKDRFTVNVIHFVAKNDSSGRDDRFYSVANLTRGKYRQIRGMAAIKSYYNPAAGADR
jgi:hypothetical protein